MLSDFENNMQEDARNTILVLENYDGENLGEFRQNLAAYGAIKVRNENGAKGGVSTLTVSVNAENYNAIVSLYKKALIENAKGYDASELRSGGTPNQMNIKSVFNDLDLDANGMETHFQTAITEVLWFYNRHLMNNGYGDFSNEHIDIIFNRDGIVSESEVIADIKNSQGILSDETLIAQHPYVTDPEEEIRKRRKSGQ